jgi:exonuclease SbcD
LGFEITKIGHGDPKGRRKRADSIVRNFETIVQHAEESAVDLFLHSGDLFNKYYIPRGMLDLLVRPLLNLEKSGVPVLIIPGNHERSELPFDLFHGLRRIFVFDRPKSVALEIGGYSVGIAGFPFIRHHARRTFREALEETQYDELRSDLNILLTHQAFDGATVGPTGFTFRTGRADTVSREMIPLDFDYVAAGHIHRHQVLAHPLKPGLNIVYPGSIQRMSFAEMHEEKGFVEGEVHDGKITTRFIPLPAHEMEIVEIDTHGVAGRECEALIRNQFWRLAEDLVIRFNLTGGEKVGDYPEIDLTKLRAEMPEVLECQFALKAGKRWVHR